MRRLVEHMQDEDGSVLIAVIGIMLLLTAVAIGAYAMSSDNLFQTQREKLSTQALHVADAGLDEGMWRLQVQGQNAVGSFNFIPPSNTASATVTVTQNAPFLFTVAATARSTSNPNVKRSVYTQVFSMSLWNFVMATNSASPIGSGGGHFNGNGLLDGPFYIRGSLDFTSGNSAFTGGPLFVKKGDIVLSGSSSIGTGAQLVDVYCDGHVPAPGSANWHVSKGGTVNANVPEIQLPALGNSQLTEDRATAVTESTDGSQGTEGKGGPNQELLPAADRGGVAVGTAQSLSGQYKVVDDDTSSNRSLSAGLVLDQSGPAFGLPSDDFAFYDDPATPGDPTKVLYVRGTVFIDGPLTIGNVRYVGNGTLVVNGNININGNLLPYTAFPNPDALGLAAASPPADQPSVSGAISMNGSNGSQVTAALYAGYSFNMNYVNQVLTGSILSQVVGLGHNGTVHTVPSLPTYLPPSLPGGDGDMTFPSSWHEGLPPS